MCTQAGHNDGAWTVSIIADHCLGADCITIRLAGTGPKDSVPRGSE